MKDEMPSPYPVWPKMGFDEWLDWMNRAPEPELSKEDEAALEAKRCPVCELPGMKGGKCVFSELHRT